MGKWKDRHKQRVQDVKNFAAKNKLFTVITCVIIIAMIGNFAFNQDNQDQMMDNETSQSETIEEIPSEEETLQWRFYWIDLWILLIGGGFCAAMIIKERKKVREKL